MSIPAVTPAAVTILPSSTKRPPTGSAPNCRSDSSRSQFEVARFPSSSPAAPSTSDPVQTEVVHLVAPSTSRSHCSSSSSCISGRLPMPPGTRTRSGEVT